MPNTSQEIPFNVPYVTGRELGYLEQVIESGHFAGNGPFTKKAERLLEQRYDVPHVLLTHSCTGALELSALLLGLTPDDEVIVPSYTFVSTAAAFLRTGARIVFAEVKPPTMNIDVDDVERKLSPRTRAIVPVHYGGIGADMDRLALLASRSGAVLVEDAAQGLEARIDDRWLGSIAPLGTTSFHETKNIHSGLGGALFLNDSSLFEKAEDIWERGTNRAKLFKGLVDKYTWVELGSSFYPSELQAAFLYAQLESIDENLAERLALYGRYDELLRPMEGDGAFELPEVPSSRILNGHTYYLVANSIADADRIRIGLKERHINAYIGYVPLHSSPMGASLGYEPSNLPVTEEYAQRVLRLPLHNAMTVDDVDLVALSISEVLAS
ncbi:MAG: dTDP-4-amino-4,6-dideoxygalactose transaminase [Actinomycetia bacterium]|nr:dTDP-4-amino-4,6-dideoxygalactose transaminase [Actinomycetes bacterium]